jgi:hypothetical protein
MDMKSAFETAICECSVSRSTAEARLSYVCVAGALSYTINRSGVLFLVSLVSLVQPNKQDKPNKPDRPDQPDRCAWE